MSTYSDSKFNTSHYNSARPNYPIEFYNDLISYHSKIPQNRNELALDIGCGSGFATITLTQFFTNVIGTDLSPVMIKESEKNAKGIKGIKFIVSPAEKSPTEIKEGSVDLITAAECVHWFDHDSFYEECHRILKPGGTLSYWFYKDPKFVKYPKANDIYDKYCYDDPRYMGPKWQQPGRNHLRTLMNDISPPLKYFKDIVRNEYNPLKDDTTKSNLIIAKKMNLNGMKEYVQSWSAYHSWMKDNAGSEDVADLFVNELKNEMGWDDDFEFEISWDTVYTFAKKI